MTNTRRIDIPSGGFSTRLIDEGAGPPVLLLHGSPDSASEWVPLIERLRLRRRCLAPDLTGMGESQEPPPSFAYTVERHLGFIDDVLAAVLSQPQADVA